MFYTIYKITNILNGKIYIGKHQTKDIDDGYMGSGKHLKRAISKHGIENFKKEILFQFDNEADMNTKEAELVTEEFCLKEDTYNLCPGGNGGWGYVNTSSNRNGFENRIMQIKNTTEFLKWSKKGGNSYANRIKTDPDFRSKVSETTKIRNKMHPNGFINKNHTENTKKIIGEKSSISQSGPGNSQFGTIWITDGISNRKIKKTDVVPDGWKLGRKIK
jgi:hypothetical protein